MKTIFLTGFMGAGKTTVAREFGKKFSILTVDTDCYIENKHGKLISAIFAQEGEGAFRKYETEALMALPKENTIVATGGGTIVKAENRQLMRERGDTIHLFCQLEEVRKRVGNDPNRPLLQRGDEFIEKLYKERQKLYETADFTIDTTDKTVTEVIGMIEEWIGIKGE